MTATRKLRGLVGGLGFGGTLYGALGLCAVAALPLRGRRRPIAAVVRSVASVAVPIALRLGGVRIVGRGVERARELAPGGFILVANHSSNLDPMALITVLGRVDLTFVAKAETLRRPLLGELLEAIGWMAVERDSLAALKKLREEVEARREDGWTPDLVIFPEGTRSPDGALQKFRIGPFMLAAQLGLPILPVVIRGAAALHPKDAFVVHPGTIDVEVLEPIAPPPGKRKAIEQVDVAADLLRRTEALFRAALAPVSVPAAPSVAPPRVVAQGAS